MALDFLWLCYDIVSSDKKIAQLHNNEIDGLSEIRYITERQKMMQKSLSYDSVCYKKSVLYNMSFFFSLKSS